MFKRAKNYILLAIVILSTIASSFSFSNSASAAAMPSLFLSPQIESDAIASAYRTSLALCFVKGTLNGENDGSGDGNTVTAQGIVNGKWFNQSVSEPQVRAGYLVDSNNGQISCSNLFNGHDVAGSLGWNSNIELACGIGMRRKSNPKESYAACVADAGGDFTDSPLTDVRNNIYAALDAHRSNTGGQTSLPGEGTDPLHGYTHEQEYVMAANTFLTACGGTPVVNVADATPDQKNSGLVVVNVVDYQGGMTQVYYQQGNNGGKAFRNNNDGDFTYITKNCDWMRGIMAGIDSEDYQHWIGSHGPGTDGNPGTCDERYSPTADKTNNAACIQGYNNKGTPNYCPATYPTTTPFTQAELSACIYGYGTATYSTGTTAAPTPPATKTSSKSSCGIVGIGWIICPIVNDFLAPAVDAAYGFVSALLTVQPLVSTGGGPSTQIYTAWSVMRNFANIAFVIAFLLIIFSQLTSIGISNYGVKKLLPRLVISAILVNISFWICAVAVDLSNILGSSMNGIFQGITNTLANAPGTQQSAFTTGHGSTWVTIAGFALAGVGLAAVAFYATLSALLPILLIIFITIITTVVALAIRQALIILLIVISPLAFVAYLLPNTESLFHKWRKLFQDLLLMYMIIAFIFGGSKLASEIVSSTASTVAPDYQLVIQIIGAFITVIPLILVPLIMKGANNLVGKVMNSNGHKFMTAPLQKKAEGFKQQRQDIAAKRRIDRAAWALKKGKDDDSDPSRKRRFAAWAVGSGVTTGINTAQKAKSAKDALAQAQQDYIVDRAKSNASGKPSEYAKNIAGPTGNATKIQNAATAAQRTATADAIKNAKMSANINPGDVAEMGKQLQQALIANDDIKARAMQDMLMASGGSGISQYRKSLIDMEDESKVKDGGKGLSSDAAKDLRQNMLDNHGKVKADAADLIKHAANQTGANLSSISGAQSTWTMSADDFAKQKKDSHFAALDANAVTASQAKEIMETPELAKHIDPAVHKEFADLPGYTGPAYTGPPIPPRR